MTAIGELLAEMERAAEEEYAPILRATERSRFREIVRRAAPRRILEIGTAIGYSAFVALSESAADTVVVTLEKDPVMAKRAAAFLLVHLLHRGSFCGRGTRANCFLHLRPGLILFLSTRLKGSTRTIGR